MKLYGNYGELACNNVTRLLMKLGVHMVYDRISVASYLQEGNVFLRCGDHIYRATLPYTVDEIFDWHVTVKDEDIDAFPDTIEYWRPVTDFEKQQAIASKERTSYLKTLEILKNHGL